MLTLFTYAVSMLTTLTPDTSPELDMFRPLPGLFTASFLLASATFASSQQPTATDPAAAELQNCVRFIGSKQMKEAASSARNAEAMYRAELTRNPRDANAIVG